MLVEFSVQRFKSFREARLPLAELTVLVGTNASGKSNLIEAMRLLSWLAQGRELGGMDEALRKEELEVRGPVTRFLYEESQSCVFGGIVSAEQMGQLELSLELRIHEGRWSLVHEGLWRSRNAGKDCLYEGGGGTNDGVNTIRLTEYEALQLAASDNSVIFPMLAGFTRQLETKIRPLRATADATNHLQSALKSIVFLDPVPRHMRSYRPAYARSLGGDGANLSSVLFELIEKHQAKDEVLAFVRALPEQNISDISFIRTPRDEVMVELTESFGGKLRKYEAELLSDGTLRVLAVAAALLSVPEGTLVVIEEIDNGVHPTRAKLLLDNIHRVAKARKLRVLLTTHNPALLDAIPVEAIPDVVACYRDAKEGDSRLVALKNLEDYPELVAQGRVGELVTQGILERYVKYPKSPEQKAEEARRVVEMLRQPLEDEA